MAWRKLAVAIGNTRSSQQQVVAAITAHNRARHWNERHPA